MKPAEPTSASAWRTSSDAIGPLLIGAASDAIAPTVGTESLLYALALMLLAPLAASLMLWLALRRIADRK